MRFKLNICTIYCSIGVLFLLLFFVLKLMSWSLLALLKLTKICPAFENVGVAFTDTVAQNQDERRQKRRKKRGKKIRGGKQIKASLTAAASGLLCEKISVANGVFRRMFHLLSYITNVAVE